MEFLKQSELTPDKLSHQPFGIPVLLCSPAPAIISRFRQAGYREMSLNRLLSAELLLFPAEERPLRAPESFHRLLLSRETPVLLRDFEMLFDPRYQLDVLKAFCEVSRVIPLAAVWPGRAEEGFLEYGEAAAPDYAKYETSRYTLICVN